MKATYYIVQATARLFAVSDEHGRAGLSLGFDSATRFALPDARRVLREIRRDYGDNGPRRFPRIVKVTIETTTIKED